jgi:PAS domain S-box-containing protein
VHEETAHEPRRLSDFLRDHRARILARWEEGVRELRPARGLARPALLDHIPQLLEALEDYVSDVRRDPALNPSDEFPRIHAVERLELGYDLTDVIEEYSVLRNCIADMAAAERAAAVRSLELPRLHRAIDRAIAVSVQRYERSAAEVRGRLGAELRRERSRVDETLAQVKLRAAELEAVIESIPDAVYIGDATGIKRANRVALEQLGYDSVEQLNRDIAALVDDIKVRNPDDLRPLRVEEQVYTRALNGETATYEVIVRNRKTGKDLVVRSTAAPIRLGAELIGAVTVNTDITERRRRDEELRKALDLSERIRGVLGHDLRNPLGVISASAALLQREPLDPRLARIVARIGSNAERIQRMVHDLLDYTRVRMGQGIPLTPRPTDLAAVSHLVAEESELLQPGISIQVRVDGEHARGEWDPDRAYQAVSNLVANAVRHAAPGTPVTISLRGFDDHVELGVHNFGEPIDEELIPRLFAAFERGPASGGGVGAGLGLGLYIVKQIAAAHGGEVRVRSDGGEGTTFTMAWPRRRPAG